MGHGDRCPRVDAWLFVISVVVVVGILLAVVRVSL